MRHCEFREHRLFGSASRPPMGVCSTGFTLIEAVFVLLIISSLATISYPQFQAQLEKAQLTELSLRIDAMRTAAKAALARGDRSLLNFSRSTPGSLPPDISPGIFEDTLRYGKFQLLMAHSDKTIQQFQGGIRRPYLVISSSDAESAKSLRNFSEIMPSSAWAWWASSRLMVIPLLDDADLIAPAAVTSGTAGSPSVSGTAAIPANPGAGTTPGNSGTSGAATSGSGTPALSTTAASGSTSGTTSGGTTSGTVGSSTSGTGGTNSSSTGATTAIASATSGTGTTTVLTPTNTGQTPGAVSGSQALATRPSATGCVHPGNGHAFGRCSH